MKISSVVIEGLRLAIEQEVFLVHCHLHLKPKSLKVIVHQFVKRQWLSRMKTQKKQIPSLSFKLISQVITMTTLRNLMLSVEI